MYEVGEGEVAGFIAFVKTRMEAPIKTLGGLTIPVDVKTGMHWGNEMRDWGKP